MDFGTWLGLVFICVCVIVAVWAINKDKYENSEQGRKDREDSERHRLKREIDDTFHDMCIPWESKWFKVNHSSETGYLPAVLYYYARNIIHDKYTDEYIQVVCDKSALEEAIKDFPDWELCYPSKELLEKVSAQIMETEMFKEIKENGGLLKHHAVPAAEALKKMRASFFNTNIPPEPDIEVVWSKEEFVDSLIDKCYREGFKEAADEFYFLTPEERNELIKGHDQHYKWYVLQNLWMAYVFEVPESSPLSIFCDIKGKKKEALDAMKSYNEGIRKLNSWLVYNEERELKGIKGGYEAEEHKENGLVSRDECAEKVKRSIYKNILIQVTEKNKNSEESKMDGISLMLFPIVSKCIN